VYASAGTPGTSVRLLCVEGDAIERTEDDERCDGAGPRSQAPTDAHPGGDRFAGLGRRHAATGEQFTTEAAWAGNDISTLPNFPAEIRAPAGTLFGVSSFQLQFGSQRVYTPGDQLDALVAMNPAALKVHLADLKPGAILIVNTAAFESHPGKAGARTRSTATLGKGTSTAWT
jgi:hypothetical protein